MPNDISSLTVAELRSVVLGWDGDESVTVGDALTALTAANAAGAEGERQNREREAAIQTWIAGRTAAARAAAAEAEGAHAGEPRRHQAAQEAAVRAAAAFERRVPRPTGPGGQPLCPLGFVSEAEVGTIKAAVHKAKEFVA
jgi:hypothetical protein